jgi:hypothetical protein
MELPQRFPDTPPLRAVGFFLGVGALIILATYSVAVWAALIFGIPLVLLGLIGMVERLAEIPIMEVGQNGLLLRSGILGFSRQQIAYEEIYDLREITLDGNPLLMIYTTRGQFQIYSGSLPSREIYMEIKDLVSSRMKPKQDSDFTVEEQRLIKSTYMIQCSWEGHGQLQRYGESAFQFKTLHPNPSYHGSCYGIFRLPEFVLYDKDDKEWLRVKRSRRFPHARFAVSKNGLPICVVKQRSVFRTKYSIEFQSSTKWLFRMPLFSMNYSGISEDGGIIHVRIRSHQLWYVRIEPDCAMPELLGVIAFLHREHLRCN